MSLGGSEESKELARPFLPFFFFGPLVIERFVGRPRLQTRAAVLAVRWLGMFTTYTALCVECFSNFDIQRGRC